MGWWGTVNKSVFGVKKAWIPDFAKHIDWIRGFKIYHERRSVVNFGQDSEGPSELCMS